MNSLTLFSSHAPIIEERLGYVFQDKRLLMLAFIHRSFVNENRDLVAEHNERLEFLGDSILGCVVAEFLFRNNPTTPEGELSHLRSRLVQSTACASYVEKLDLGAFLLLGRGEQMSEGRGRESIHADLLEAIIGAIFIDGGLAAARDFLFDNFLEEMSEQLEAPSRNWKAELQDYSQRVYHETPYYEVVSESGPDHSKEFIIGVSIQGESFGAGRGSSKKEAQQFAAQAALQKISLSPVWDKD